MSADDQLSISEQPADLASQEKKPWAKPELKSFGSVRDLTMGFGGSGGDGLLQLAPSDARFKENVVEVGRHSAGFGLYLFDYKPAFKKAFGEGRQFGVIAQEVERVVPAAVGRDASGYRFVNYALLGITRH